MDIDSASIPSAVLSSSSKIRRWRLGRSPGGDLGEGTRGVMSDFSPLVAKETRWFESRQKETCVVEFFITLFVFGLSDKVESRRRYSISRTLSSWVTYRSVSI